MKLGIRWKLTLGTGVPLALLLGVTVLATFLKQRERAIEQALDALATESRYHATRFEAQFQQLSQIARSTALFLESHTDLKEEELYELLERNVGQSDLVYGACIAFEPGVFGERRLVAPYVYRGEQEHDTEPPADLPRLDVADVYDYTDGSWEWYASPREDGRGLWTEPFFDRGAGDVVMCTFSAPFRRGGKFAGVATVDVRLEDLNQLIGTIGPAQRPTQTGILSRRGTFVYWPEPAVIMNESLESLAERFGRPGLLEIGKRAISGEMGTERIRGFEDDDMHLVSFAPIRSTGWTFLLAVPERVTMRPVFAELRTQAASSLLIILLLMTVVGIIGRWLSRPVERLAASVTDLAEGNLNAAPVETQRSDEIGDLARTFNTMLGQLRSHVAALTEATRVREAAESELRVAREIQLSLLPTAFPPFPEHKELDLHAVNAPARHVGGDYFDFFRAPDGKIMVFIADVAGKGVPAAMLMAVTRTVVRNLAERTSSPAAMLSLTNAALLESNESGMFVTMVAACYDPASGRLLIANGGHPPPLVLGSNGSIRSLGNAANTILGVVEDERYEDHHDMLMTGETLLFYTDGVTEARAPGGAMFSEERLSTLLATLNGLHARELVDRLVGEVDAFQNEQRADDITVMALRRNF